MYIHTVTIYKKVRGKMRSQENKSSKPETKWTFLLCHN